jgi:leucyl aminopeptidase
MNYLNYRRIVVQIQCQLQLTPNAETCLITTPSSKHLTLQGIKDLSDTFGAVLFLPFTPNFPGKVLLVNPGKSSSLTPNQYQKLLKNVALALNNISATNIHCELTAILEVQGKSAAWKTFHAAYQLGHKFYRFNQFKSKKTEPSATTLSIESAEKTAATQATAVLSGTTLLRDLGNLPANICTPTYLADTAKKLSQTFPQIKTDILEETEMQKLGMNTLLSVSKGTKQPPKFIIMHYQGGDTAQKPFVFVGKGVTFDSGGISIKPSAAMDEMKYDMCGAATVISLLQVAAQLKLPLNIVGLVPTVENMPSGQATRPGDIVTSLAGKTVEILNTDAEGRLILCDALTYAEKFSPEVVIDTATLTGSAILTFGNLTNALMGNDQSLVDELLSISEACGERTWQLPLWEEYQEMLTSNFADIPNIHNDNNAKCIIAGCFLSQFTQNYKWAHLDIAGTAWISGKEKGATGRPLMLLVNYLLAKAGMGV